VNSWTVSAQPSGTFSLHPLFPCLPTASVATHLPLCCLHHHCPRASPTSNVHFEHFYEAYCLYDPIFCILHPFFHHFRINHRKDVGEHIPDNRIIFLRHTVAGIGDEIGEPVSGKGPLGEIRYKRPPPAMALERQRYLRQCAGLPRDPPPATGASVLLVNRPHGDGRHILGLDDVYDKLLRELPPDIPVRLFYPRSEGLADQAAAFSSANVLVVPHGAANANFAFLPHKATIFALFAVDSRLELDQDHAGALPSPPYNITVVPVNCSGRGYEMRMHVT